MIPVVPSPLIGTSESNSSKKRMVGAFAIAFSKTFLTFCSDYPIYLLNSSGPLIIYMYIESGNEDIYLYTIVLPHPLGPNKRIPLGNDIPQSENSAECYIGSRI